MENSEGRNSNSKKFDKVIETIKIFGYMLGGIWILFIYFKHDRELKKAEIKKDSLEIKRLAQDSVLKELEIKYAPSLKDYEYLSNSIELRYKDIENQLSVQKTRFEIDATNLNIKAKEIENEISEIKLKYSKDRKIIGKFVVTPENLGKDDKGINVYRLIARFELQNNSDVELEVSLVSLEMFLNKLGYRYLKHDNVEIVGTYDTPNIFNSKEFGNEGYFLTPQKRDTSMVKPSPWKRIGYDCGVFSKSEHFLTDSSRFIIKDYLKDKFFSRGTFCTGIIKPKEMGSFERIYFVRAETENILGVTLNIVLNKGLKNEDCMWFPVNQILQ